MTFACVLWMNEKHLLSRGRIWNWVAVTTLHDVKHGLQGHNKGIFFIFNTLHPLKTYTNYWRLYKAFHLYVFFKILKLKLSLPRSGNSFQVAGYWEVQQQAWGRYEIVNN